jgi:hypothetical protein
MLIKIANCIFIIISHLFYTVLTMSNVLHPTVELRRKVLGEQRLICKYYLELSALKGECHKSSLVCQQFPCGLSLFLQLQQGSPVLISTQKHLLPAAKCLDRYIFFIMRRPTKWRNLFLGFCHVFNSSFNCNVY